MSGKHRSRMPVSPPLVAAAFALLAIALLALFAVQSTSRTLVVEAERNVRSAATSCALAVHNELRAVVEIVTSHAQRPVFVAAMARDPALAHEAVQAHLSHVVTTHSGLAAAWVSDENGVVLGCIPETPDVVGHEFRSREWFQQVTVTQAPHVSAAYESRLVGHPHVVAIAAPVYADDTDGGAKRLIGILGVAYSLEAFDRFVSAFGDSERLQVSVSDQRGLRLAGSGRTGRLSTHRTEPLVRAALADSITVGRRETPAGREVAAAAPVPVYGWTVMAGVPEQAALLAVTRLRSSLFLLAAVALAATGIGLWLALRAQPARVQADVPALERTAAALQARQGFLDGVLDNIPYGVLVRDARTLRPLLLNRSGARLLGVDAATFCAADAAEPHDERERADRAALASDAALNVAQETIGTGEDSRVLLMTRVAVRVSGDRPEYLLTLVEDVTEREAEARHGREALAEAERANIAKSEFLARMSHELRTPLNAILGFAQVLDMDGLATDQRASVQQIMRGGQHLLELINEVLDLARIEAGRLTVAVEPVDMHDVAHSAVAFMRPLAAQRAVHIECSHEHAFVLADVQRLKQVVLNLLANAIKYNTRGGTVRIEYDHASPGRLGIHISDTGAGIPAPQLANLFLPFVRLHTDDEPTEGTGLGLALSQRLVELMAGSISVRSTVGVGSTFTLYFPSAPDPGAGGAPVAVRAGAQRGDPGDQHLLLYIEDNPSNIRLLTRIVARRPNMRLLAAMHGRLGIELARQHRPAVILLDLHLPDMAGADVLRELKSDAATQGIPVVVVSADATARQQQTLLASGACAYVTKPFDVHQMLNAITNALAAPAALGTATYRSVDGDV